MTDPSVEPRQPLVELKNVSKRFRIHRERQRSLQESFIRLFRREHRPQDYFWPLRDVSFSVYPGDSVGILGPNGSGKSTMLKLVTGILEPTEGQITLRGQVASLLELGAGFHPDLTGRENIFLNGSVYGFSRKQMQARLESIIDFAELGDFIDTPVKHYSSGMYVRLGFSVAIHTDPDVLIVDEVLTVGDQVFQQKCLERIYDMKRAGVAIILVSHSLADVQRLCDRAIWLDQGLVRADGPSIGVVDEYLADANDRYYQQRRKREVEKPPDEFTIQTTPQRWGTGDAVIAKVEILGKDGTTPEYFRTGDMLRLRVHYKTRKPIDTPTFGLAIYRRDGAHVNGPNSIDAGYRVPQIDGGGVMEYTIDALPLNPGHFELTAAIYNHDSSVAMDHHHRLYRFEVRSPTLRHEEGIVHIPATWHHVGYQRRRTAADSATDSTADSAMDGAAGAAADTTPSPAEQTV
ncbi:MAG: ABC transporter ATP-binding protein [Caldilineaceae bacterium]|nr:ABC transporter ATP-binding protein [Caldilineaceae bacterium]